MEFRLERDVFADAVAWAARSLPIRPSVPVLAGLVIEANSGKLVISGFDYEVSARVEIDADVPSQGKALVSGRLLADISRNLPDRPVQVTTEETKVVLTCGGARFTLLTLPLEDYPVLPEMPSSAGSVMGGVFATAVSQVAIAAVRDDTLPVLTGIRMEIEGENLTLAATDRYRLAVRELTWTPEQTEVSAVALVPARTLADSAKSLAGNADNAITIALATTGAGEGMMGFAGNGRRTTSRLLEGEFPKYRALLPTEYSATATVATQSFVEAIKRVALVAERNTPIRLAFSASELVIEAGSKDEAQACEGLGVTLEGEDIAIAFNPAFLLDGLDAIDAPVTHLSFTSSTTPAVITGKASAEAETSSEYRYLVMPVRLS